MSERSKVMVRGVKDLFEEQANMGSRCMVSAGTGFKISSVNQKSDPYEPNPNQLFHDGHLTIGF